MALDREQVVSEAVRLLDDEGLDALSLRTLAARLGVQAPTLYWHIRNKAELLDAVADAIMDDAIAAVPASGTGDDWAQWLLSALIALRSAMLRHRDGARTIAGARVSLRRADFTELAMSTLVGHGVEAARARLVVLAGERFTVGYVLEEQPPSTETPEPPDVDELRRRFPVSTQAIAEYFESARTTDDLYRDIARLILNLPQLPS